ncbi:MAG: DNA-processing protein DprA [Deltaproteobacteria bacterium]|nr:DNA-processing protein DprA [Candidatus Deferrimicrobiaceae bacterium]
MTSESAPSDILLRLSLVEGVTAGHLRRLRRADRTPFLPDASGKTGQGILRRAVDALTSREAGERADRVRQACAKAAIRVIPLDSVEYPQALRTIPDAPLVLYRAGDSVAGNQAVAIVGSRAPTAPAKEFAGDLASDLAGAGWTVVSGMARGIDASAHEGALRGGGNTVAVLGCGVDVVYPPEASGLRRRILEQGSLLSEYPPGTLPLSRHFPARNRIISGISRGVVVVEAPCRSGALITARLALDQGREVLAVPGNPLFPHTAGSNRLIREGAEPATCAEDVIAALADTGRAAEGRQRERRILEYLSRPRHVDEISEALGIPPQELLPALLEMELRKLLVRRAGDYYKKMSER